MLYNQGKSAMQDYHLIAAIANIPVDKAREILARADHKLGELARWDLEKWLKIDGIGYTRATALVTSFELGRRRMVEKPDKRIKINCSQDVYNWMKSSMTQAPHGGMIIKHARFHLTVEKKL